MKQRVAVLCLLLVTLTSAAASAASGVNLRWNHCIGDGGVQDRAFACDRNNGTNALEGSFELDSDVPQATGLEIIVDIATASATLPDWWQIFRNAGACRQNALNMSPVADLASVACVDWTQGEGAGGIAAYNVGVLGPSSARIVAGFALPADAIPAIVAGQEYFAFNARIINSKSIGTGACDGCAVPACIVFTSVKVTTPSIAGQPTPGVTLSGPANGTDSNFATWQGGAGVTSLRGQGCPAATPTQTTTWSRVKTLYR